jgi:hypothetical protein
MTNFQIPKQQASRYKGGLIGMHKYPDTGAPEVSKWSSSSSDRSTREAASNCAHGDKSDSSNKPESPFDHNETTEQRLERWQKFYSEKTMESYFDKDDYEEYLDDLLFDKLYDEVQYTVYETGPSKYRGQEQVRFFWDDVRRQLRDGKEPALEWPPTEELQHCTAGMYDDNPSGDFQPLNPPKDSFANERRSRIPPPSPKLPILKGTADGWDLELMEIREWLMKRQREREQGPKP